MKSNDLKLPHVCKAIGCFHNVPHGEDFCGECTDLVREGDTKPAAELAMQDKPSPIAGSALAQQYPQYHKDVRHLNSVDVYAVHHLFGIDDPSGALQHASKKLLLSGVRTGNKTKAQDIREARDTLNRWLELHG